MALPWAGIRERLRRCHCDADEVNHRLTNQLITLSATERAVKDFWIADLVYLAGVPVAGGPLAELSEFLITTRQTCFHAVSRRFGEIAR